MHEGDDLDRNRLRKLSELTLLQREELAMLVGDAAIELWLRGETLDDLVERCVEALMPTHELAATAVRVRVAG